MTQTHLEQVNANSEFREIVNYLGSVRYLHLVPQLMRDPDGGGDRSDDPYGADFLLRIAKTPQRTRTRWLDRIGQSLKAAVPQLDQLDLVQDESVSGTFRRATNTGGRSLRGRMNGTSRTARCA